MPIQKITSGIIESNINITGNLSLDSTGTTGFRAPSANTLVFHTAGTEDMRITSAGLVGIGTTSPASKLDVFSDTVTFGDTGSFNFAINGTNVLFKNGSGGTTECMRITSSGDLRFNSGYGSVATAYGCRAWVNFQGTGTPAVRAGGNVSSITDNGEGDYTINFTNAMPDRNYAVAGAAKFAGDSTTAVRYVGISSGAGFASVMTTTSVRVAVAYANGALQDPDVATVTIHR